MEMREHARNLPKLLSVIMAFVMMFCSLSCVAFAAPSSGTYYEKVTGVSDGGQYVIVSADNTSALTSAIGAAPVTVAGNRITSTVSDNMLWTFSATDTAKYTVHNGSTYLIRKSGSPSTLTAGTIGGADADHGRWSFAGNQLYITSGSSGITYSVCYSGSQFTVTNTPANVNIYQRKAVAVSGISVRHGPAKTAYIEGEAFDPAGLTLDVLYANGDTETVSSGFACAPSGPLAYGTVSITITYGGIATSCAITVSHKTLTGIAVTKPPAKVSYAEGQAFDPAGMIVSALYNNGTSEPVTGYTWTPAGVLTAADHVITITYQGKTAVQAITVNAPIYLVSIAITKAPAKVGYAEGQAFDPAGMVVTALYSNGASYAVTGYTWSPYGSLTVTDKLVMIAYQGRTTAQPISVVAKGAMKLIVKDAAGIAFPGVGIKVYRDEKLTVIVGQGVSDAAGAVVITGLDTATYWITVAYVPTGYALPSVKVPASAAVGETREYTVVVPKTDVQGLGSDRLAAIQTSAGTLSPAFDPKTLNYTLTLGEAAGTATIKPVLADATSRLTINGRKISSATVSVRPGATAILIIRVKPAAGGSACYTITVTRAKSTNADLSWFAVRKGTLNPAFNSAVTSYALGLPHNSGSVRITSLKTAGAYATYTLTLDGKRLHHYRTITIKPGQTKTLLITVKAQAGNTKTYAFVISRAK